MTGYYSALTFVAVCMLATLALLVRENSRWDTDTKSHFYYCYFVIVVAVLAEWLGIVLNGAPESTKPLHIMVKCIDYIFTPAAGLYFVYQVNVTKRLKDAMIGILAVNGLLQIGSMFFGWTFYVDDANVYHHGPLYFLYVIVFCDVIFMLLLEFIRYGQKFRKQNRGGIFMIVFTLVACIVLQEVFGYRVVSFGLIMGSSMLFIHYSEFRQMTTDQHINYQKQLLDKDALTGLFSRYAYVDIMSQIGRTSKFPSNVAVFSIDLNGLKHTNDNFGHSAGDELLQAAAICINQSLSAYGKCFRIGGDEFVALLETDKEQAKVLMETMRLQASQWQGNLVKELSFSIGYASSQDYPGKTMQELLDIADEKMYEDKRRYYAESGHDRRTTREIAKPELTDNSTEE